MFSSDMPTDSNENPTVASSSSSHPTRSTSPSRQVNKLKRFLSTLYHFGSDLSRDVAERVRTLILALLNNALSVEEFHAKVQATTNFPLRPFALPFLKSTLPLLQKDLAHLARQSKQSTSQYLAQHEDLILLPRDALETPGSHPSTANAHENGKRKLADELYQFDERPYATKRASMNHINSNHHRPFVSSNNQLIAAATIRRDFREKERSFTAYLREYGTDFENLNGKNTTDDWKNAENMLNCILEMVTKTKRALFALQQKDSHVRRLMDTNDLDWRRRHSELVSQTDDRIGDIRRKAEETVLEVKRQSIIDLQKAVAQTEQKSNELLVREREQYQRLNQELKVQTFEEAYALLNRQDDGPEQCWHCGRKAIETCSGCNLARYCGQYCQHRDWECHQKLCGLDFKRKFLENPQLYRRATSKTNPSVSEQKEDSTSLIPHRSSPTTPYLHVSSPVSKAGEDVKSDIDTDERPASNTNETV